MISPEDSFRKIIESKKTLNGVYVFIFFSAFLGIMIGSLIAGITGITFLPLIVALIYVILGLLNLLIWAGITHIIAKFLFKGEGNFVNLFGLLGYTSVTFILGIFALMTLILGTTIISSWLLFTLMIFWILIIGIVAVEAEYKIGIGKSFLSLCGIPILILVLIFLLLGV
jgi:hypothetical protein